jgi:hypothetical protein
LTGSVLRLMSGEYAVWKLPPDAPAPQLASDGFSSITRTLSELSVVSPAAAVPPDVEAESGWRCLEVAGPLAFELTGVLAGLSAPLASAGIPIFVVSTYDTDYLLVKSRDLDRATTALELSGHRVKT